MMTLKRILVPHDFGETSVTAMKYATALARMFGAALDVLHVREGARLDIPTAFPIGVEESMLEAARERLVKTASPLDKTELDLRFQLRAGAPHSEIVHCAKERNADLIVMGTHGWGVVAHAVMGSVAERVVRTAPCPVLTVRTPLREFVVSNILVATDFGAASETALEHGRTLARTFGASLHLLHVAENCFMRPIVADPHALEAGMRRQLNDRLIQHDRLTPHATAALELSDDPAMAIVDHANNMSIDLIVMGTHGRQSIDRLLMGSVAEHVVRTASCPVLTVRHPEREFVVDDAPEAANVSVSDPGVTGDRKRRRG